MKGATGKSGQVVFIDDIISIHAPVKGATQAKAIETADVVRKISIHAPVKGATMLRQPSCACGNSISIHAPVKGATALEILEDTRHRHFNPRTREGCDGLQIGPVTICSLINHIAN